MNEFQEQLLDHYKNPKNYGNPSWKDIKSYEAENLTCGDSIKVFVDIDSELIKNISFTGEGCSIAIGTASLLTEKVKGLTVGEVQKLNEKDILELVGFELTPSRIRCATLSLEALKNAINK